MFLNGIGRDVKSCVGSCQMKKVSTLVIRSFDFISTAWPFIEKKLSIYNLGGHEKSSCSKTAGR